MVASDTSVYLLLRDPSFSGREVNMWRPRLGARWTQRSLKQLTNRSHALIQVSPANVCEVQFETWGAGTQRPTPNARAPDWMRQLWCCALPTRATAAVNHVFVVFPDC